MQQMIWRWKAWTNAKLFGIYCFSQFLTVLSQFWKWLKTYFRRNFYKLYRNGANNIPLKSYGKCETFSCWWFSLIPSRFQVISKTARSFVLPLSRKRFFENAPREELELLGMSTWTSLCFSRVFFLVALHPLTGIEQVIYRWKVVVNTQLSRVDHFFILATILKVFHLKFIQCSSWTSCCFHVELLWRIFVCNFLIHSSVLHKWYSFCTNLSHNIFLTFSDRGLELTQMIFLLFWSKLENDEIMISAFIVNGNALREVVELLGHVCLNFTLFFDVLFFSQ